MGFILRLKKVKILLIFQLIELLTDINVFLIQKFYSSYEQKSDIALPVKLGERNNTKFMKLRLIA